MARLLGEQKESRRGLRLSLIALQEFDLVVLIAMNAAADAIFAVVQVALLGFGQMSVVSRHIFPLRLLQLGFAFFQMRRFFRAQRAVADATSNALLLTSFAAVDLVDARVARIFHARACC